MHVVIRSVVVLVAGLWLAGCATGFPRAAAPYAAADGLDGTAVLARSVAAHGGDLRTRSGDAGTVRGGSSSMSTRSSRTASPGAEVS